jgi:GNAT superfamily N-acetyltransferase
VPILGTSVALTVTGLRQEEYLAKVTEFMTECRRRAVLAGLWDAADFHWWWRDGGYDNPDHQLFFEAESGQPAGFVLLSDRYETFDYEILPGLEDTEIGARIFSTGLGWLQGKLRGPAHSPAVNFFVRDSHNCLRLLAEEAGFRASDRSYVQTVRQLSAPLPTAELPASHRLRSIRDADLRDGRPPVLRLSREPFDRVRESPMYRPENHLIVVDGNGRPVAECIYWADDASGVGLFEPVETLAEHRRSGFGRALLLQGMRRMATSGLKVAKVSHYSDNVAAAALYGSVGFRPTFERIVYVTDR